MEPKFSSLCTPPDPDMIALGDAAVAALTNARLEMDRKIDYDIALLMRAGIALGRISMQVIVETGEQRLLVGEAVVQRYQIVPTADGTADEIGAQADAALYAYFAKASK